MADLSGTRFCDTWGIHALVMACKRAKASNTGFRVVVPPGEVRRVLGILHLDPVLAIYPWLDLALLAGDRKPAQVIAVSSAVSRTGPVAAGSCAAAWWR